MLLVFVVHVPGTWDSELGVFRSSGVSTQVVVVIVLGIPVSLSLFESKDDKTISAIQVLWAGKAMNDCGPSWGQGQRQQQSSHDGGLMLRLTIVAGVVYRNGCFGISCTTGSFGIHDQKEWPCAPAVKEIRNPCKEWHTFYPCGNYPRPKEISLPSPFGQLQVITHIRFGSYPLMNIVTLPCRGPSILL